MRIVKETGKPVAHIARDLGINKYALHDWVRWTGTRRSRSDGTATEAAS
ncbi:hypothetical protein E1267_28430 [Nonomuraea longispora]|uniref:Transposase n=1 Tax=Nonomuraea longispora TaxID=1848320 RepID=A0A4R4N7G7_9ACTN|nr:hypothetical protein E1267_28430 [Nonomuraea longispora]